MLQVRDLVEDYAIDPGGGFAAGVGGLSDATFLAHFRGDRGVVYPPVPRPSVEQLRNAEQVVAGRFEFGGERHTLGARFSWKGNPSCDKEWQIAHHKFYFAVDLAHAWRATGNPVYIRRWAELIGAWLDEMGSGYIVASDAQVEAKRIEHWVLSFVILQCRDWWNHLSAALLRRFLGRVADEARYVSRHLRAGRNHRTFQLYAMFLAGVLFPEFAGARHMVSVARDKLTENLLHDFGEDGVHIELSSHYHQITLETAVAFVELARLNDVALYPALLQRLQRALEFSMWLTLPDGEVPLINDADNGDHRPLLCTASLLTGDLRLLWVGTLGGEGLPASGCARHFDSAGYFVLRNGWGRDVASFRAAQHVFYDCGKLGEGSHSHYDLFNFTYFVDGEQLVVDPGRYTYSAEPGADGIDWRREFKSTRYHNTVTIDGLDQTRYLSKSRIQPPGVERYDRTRHAAKHGPDVEVGERSFFLGRSSDWVRASARSHEYSPVHTRTLCYVNRQYLVLLDEVAADDGREHDCDLRFHLAERWQDAVTLESQGDSVLATGGRWQIRCLGGLPLQARLEAGWVSKTYGVKRPAPVIALRQTASGRLRFASVLAGSDDGVRLGAVSALDHDLSNIHGLRMEVSVNGAQYQDILLVRSAADIPYEDDCVSYSGDFLLYRRSLGGAVTYLCVSHPEQLQLNGMAQFPVSSREPL
ncbi:MAG: alginate lyase family protein [Dechloromonas sp.]|nr:alginate lyase family protein [Dechloromonas sp.]